MWWKQVVSAAFLVLAASPLCAQVVPPPAAWRHGTEVAVSVGVANGSSVTAPTAGLSLGWDVTRWLLVEGHGTWLDRGTGASGFDAGVSSLLNLVARRTVTPFVGVGFGAYRSSFQSGKQVSTDPAFRLSAGVNLLSESRQRHWTMRPEVAVLNVHGESGSSTIVSGSISVGYYFRGAANGSKGLQP